MRLEDLATGMRVAGVLPGETVTVLFVQKHGANAVELTYKSQAGALAQQVLFRKDEARMSTALDASRPFDAPGEHFLLAAEAQRIRLAGLSDPMLAIATSDVQPLPHQIHAVYEELLPRTPLRFLLADDPGAGKTIMAGLYLKELLLRGDAQRCLIVAPGGLVEQWQDELWLKFGLLFEILSSDAADRSAHINPFDRHPLLLARLDQLSRNDDLQELLSQSSWDVAVVDEAHRMAAHQFGSRVHKTRRFHLGELLGRTTRHMLLMTATPHTGKEDDFQQFLTLLDPDRFEGAATGTADTRGLMRRMVKEDLLTFDGRRLFPERIAETVPYDLTPLEKGLYERVTAYVREGMNRADRLTDRRRNTVGFALTVLQRRLASSPEAIHQSLVRRAARLRDRRTEIAVGSLRQDATPDVSVVDDDVYTAAEIEALEESLVDSATAAETLSELDAEIREIDDLVLAADTVRRRGTDRKWSELERILTDHALAGSVTGLPRKLIVFTEHRDTQTYLVRRIRALLGAENAVVAIHGGIARSERRVITEAFTSSPACRILVATDAAGEGLNLQAAHLMVNYDLPWNPNRIEQRFGRIHRIGQTEVCRLWNLVAQNTREGDVFSQLFSKVDQQRKAYGGKVFDVLGEAFVEMPLRDLLTRAIQYGERSDVRSRLLEVVDRTVGDHVRALLDDRALAADQLNQTDLATIQGRLANARAQRMDGPHIEATFTAAFTRLGGRIARREPLRHEVTAVPASIRAAKHGPIEHQYQRVAFDLAGVRPDGLPRAVLIAPGHPLHDAVLDRTLDEFAGLLNRGTVLSSASITRPAVLLGVLETVADSTDTVIARRFSYAFVGEDGIVRPAGPAPHLDMRVATGAVDRPSWLADAEATAASWVIANRLSAYFDSVESRRTEELTRTRELVTTRLHGEASRLRRAAAEAATKRTSGAESRESAESLQRSAEDLEHRLKDRLEMIGRQARMITKPPQIVMAALVLPG